MSDEDSIDRRSVLRRAGAVAALSAGSGVATARSEPSAASSERRAADGLDASTETFSARGLIDAPTTEALALEPRHVGSSDAGTFQFTIPSGAYAVSVTPTANGELRVFRRLDDGETDAIVDDDGPTRRVDPDGQTDVVQSGSCGYYCDNLCDSTETTITYEKDDQAEDAVGDCYVTGIACECTYERV